MVTRKAALLSSLVVPQKLLKITGLVFSGHDALPVPPNCSTVSTKLKLKALILTKGNHSLISTKICTRSSILAISNGKSTAVMQDLTK